MPETKLKEKGKENIDESSVNHFGREWSRFRQDKYQEDLEGLAENYFKIFPWEILSCKSVGFDMGCGSGRWAIYVSSKVKKLICIDPSAEAIKVAKKNLKNKENCSLALGSANSNNLKDNSMDFGYSLGVLHHLPDTLSALENCSRKLKKGAPFLIYLYYRFDNRGFVFRLIWRLSDFMRLIIRLLPFPIKRSVTDLLALLIYLPLARISLLLEKLGIKPSFIPLSFYKNLPFYAMRTDSLDRFGTPMEHRFTKQEIKDMMEKADFSKVTFMDEEPYWVCVGYKN